MKHLLAYIFVVFTLTSCGGGGGGSAQPPVPTTTVTRTVTFTWDANNEVSVNQLGGGYRVYYSSVSGFNINDPGVVEMDVPYVSGLTAPISIVIDLLSGTYYFKVVAYGDYPVGTTTYSSPSAQLTVNVPFS